MTVYENLIYSEPNGIPLGLDIYQPAGDGPFPILMLVHGGGWCQGDRQGYVEHGRYFAEAGYLAASIDYRLAPANPFPAACDDVTVAAAWLVAHAAEYGGDPARFGAYGGSAGAHLVTWLATAPDTPLTCCAEWAGPMDMRRDPLTPPYRAYGLAFMNNCPHDDPSAYASASPYLRLTVNTAPLLLIHGVEDAVVPADHARWMAERAREIGAPVESVLLPGVGHTGGAPNEPSLAPGWEAMMAFYARHLQAVRIV